MTDSAIQSERYQSSRDKNQRWNFVVTVLDLISIQVGRSFVLSSTILVMYLNHLTPSAAMIGIVLGLQQLGYMLPQLILVRKLEALPRKKPFILKTTLLENIPYLFIAGSILLWPRSPSWAAYTILLFCVGVSGLTGLGTPGWLGMVGKVIHPDQRGLVFSLGSGVGGLLGVGASFLSRNILKTQPFPLSYGYCFLLSFIGLALAYVFMGLTREPASQRDTAKEQSEPYLPGLLRILKSNHDFRLFLWSMILFSFGTMASSFVIVLGRRKFATDDAFAATLTMVALLTQSGGTPFLGWLSDRLGHKRLAEFYCVLAFISVSFMFFVTTVAWLFPAFVLLNLSINGMQISRMCLSLEFGSVEKIPTFTALTSTLLALPMLMAPIIGGWIIDVTGFYSLFIISLIFSGLAFCMLRWGVKDQRVTIRRQEFRKQLPWISGLLRRSRFSKYPRR